MITHPVRHYIPTIGDVDRLAADAATQEGGEGGLAHTLDRRPGPAAEFDGAPAVGVPVGVEFQPLLSQQI